MKINPALLCFTLLLHPVTNFGQAVKNYVSIHLKNETYQNGRLLTYESDYYFNTETGELVVHGKLPQDHIQITNRLGEVKLYYPQKNSVSLQQNDFYSTQNELIYYFLSNNYYDLGLAGEGFSISDTHMDGEYQVVTWNAPVGMKIVAKVEMVFKNGQPVYAAYFNFNNHIIRKIYYYDYEVYSNFMMPMKITQISYIAGGDSVIRRNTWSALKTSVLPTSDYFNFKIPDDAKVLP